MSDIITRCERHGIVNMEPTPGSITCVGEYRPGQMRYCPYCGKRTTIEWPKEEQSSTLMKKYYELAKEESTFLPPWKE